MADKITPFPGRWAGPSKPNIQNIPIRTPEGRKIRDALIKDIEQKKTPVGFDAEINWYAGVTVDEAGKPTYYGAARPVDTSKMIFVFGSNEAGIHGAGAARLAYEQRGAIKGQGYGLAGTSFAIPTKSRTIRTLPLNTIRGYVDSFLLYARKNPDMQFQVTQIGCGLAGLVPRDIAPMFNDAPSNCWFDEAWRPWIDAKNYWGTF